MQTHPDSVGQTEGLFYQPRDGAVVRRGGLLPLPDLLCENRCGSSQFPSSPTADVQTETPPFFFCVINVLGSNVHV